MGTLRQERHIIDMELKRRKLDHKVMKEKHQREREHEQHEYRMLQMRIMAMSRMPQAASAMMSSH
jgi:hypothetical protein